MGTTINLVNDPVFLAAVLKEWKGRLNSKLYAITIDAAPVSWIKIQNSIKEFLETKTLAEAAMNAIAELAKRERELSDSDS